MFSSVSLLAPLILLLFSFARLLQNYIAIATEVFIVEEKEGSEAKKRTKEKGYERRSKVRQLCTTSWLF